MKIKINRLYAFMAMLCPHVLLAQWNAVYYKTTIADTTYDIRADKHYTQNSVYQFPEYYYFYNINSIDGGIACSQAVDKSDFVADAGELIVADNKINTPVNPDKNKVVVNTRFYTDGIKSYSLYFYSSQQQRWYKKRFEPGFQGYQQPVASAIKDWEQKQSDAVAEDRLIVTVVPMKKDWQLIIGDLVVGNQVSYEYTAHHPFFKGLTNSEQPEPFILRSNYFTPLPDALNGSGLPARIYITGGKKEDTALLKKVLTACVENYPFYAERKLTKAAALKEMDSVFDHSHSYSDLVQQLTQFVQTRFDDMHFYLEYNRSNAVAKSPVRIIGIHHKYSIAANFDTAAYQVYLNDDVVAINGKPVQTIFDSIAHSKYGDNEISPVKTNLIISSILDRPASDSCLLSVRHNGKLTTTVIHYDRKYAIPDNFRPIQCEYRLYPNNIAYFRINAWEPSVYLQFVNHLQDFKKASSLIIDLRGNGGGELTTAMQLYSVFINQPTTYFNYLNSQHQSHAISVLPQSEYQLSAHLPVVILGDAVTACASETFIKAMQQRGNTHFVATYPTAGSVASKYDIILPSAVIVHTNSIENISCYNTPQDIIETHGIVPDATVNINRVEDLRPYNDKVMQEALRYLSADKTGIAENRQKE